MKTRLARSTPRSSALIERWRPHAARCPRRSPSAWLTADERFFKVETDQGTEFVGADELDALRRITQSSRKTHSYPPARLAASLAARAANLAS